MIEAPYPGIKLRLLEVVATIRASQLKNRAEKIAVVRNSKERPASLRLRLFWPLLVLLLISPVVAWKLAEKRIEESGLDHTKVFHSKPGPWGDLEYVPIDIEIPDHFVDVDQIEDTDWNFIGQSREQVTAFFKTCELTSAQFDSLIKEATWTDASEGCHVVPDDELIRGLRPQSRAKIYAALAQFPENVNQFYAFSYRPERLTERFEFSGLHESTIAQFKELLYPQGNIVRFADADVVLRKLSDKYERLRFIKTITRRSSLLVKLKVNPKTDIDGLLDYWGAGGRAKDLRPLLESLARVPEGCKIDIAHLLPPFARQRIYTYPRPVDTSNGVQADCHWTAVNFFNDQPTPIFVNPAETAKFMNAFYAEIGTGTTQARFGDMICLKTSQNIVVHSAVYIADDILFSKNGAGMNQPWIYVRLEDMIPHYMIANETLAVVTYRLKQI